ncbi:MAG: penicillin-binding protein, partial [Frankiales bacterium]|nr:penicillin-binding protein [Frankiales bacterium]
MNRPLRKVAVACLVLFGILLANANYRQIVKGSDYRDDPANRRVLERTYERERGALVLADPARTVVARSVEQDARFKYLRTYPAGPLYAPATGFYSFVYGATGMERAEDKVLSGEDDRLFVKRISDALTGREPRGGDVVLTLQAAAQQAAAAGMAGKQGAVVALDPRTGAILALVSAPSFDPNALSSFDGAAVRAAYTAAAGDPAQPLLNRALNQSYPPGSTFKVITSAAALQAGRTPETLVLSPRQLTLPQTTAPLNNFGGESCGADQITLADALRISCNTAYAQLALDIGQQALFDQAKAFGFDDDNLDVPLPVSASRFPEQQDLPSLGQSGIGQRDVRATPLQMAMVAAGIANGGTVMKPY